MSPESCPRCLIILDRANCIMIAREGGVNVKLPVFPNIFNGLEVEQIDYRPEYNVRQVMPKHSKWRDLEREEVACIDTWLVGMAKAVHDFIKKEQ